MTSPTKSLDTMLGYLPVNAWVVFKRLPNDEFEVTAFGPSEMWCGSAKALKPMAAMRALFYPMCSVMAAFMRERR